MLYRTHRQPPEAWIRPLDAHVTDMKARGLSEHTCETRWYQISTFAIFIGKPPSEVEGLDVSAWLADDGLSPSARAGRRAALAQFYRFCLCAGFVKENPMIQVPVVTRPKSLARQPAPEEAVRQGLDAADTEARLMVQLDAEAGLRREEIAKVRGEDVMSDGSNWSLIVHGKGGKDRILPISVSLAKTIREKSAGGWLFPGRNGGHCCTDHVYRVVKRVTGYPTHSLRRRFGRAAYEASGCDIRAVQELLGHSSPATTQSYIWVPRTDLREIVDQVVQHRP